jgi:hypothetical protein
VKNGIACVGSHSGLWRSAARRALMGRNSVLGNVEQVPREALAEAKL